MKDGEEPREKVREASLFLLQEKKELLRSGEKKTFDEDRKKLDRLGARAPPSQTFLAAGIEEEEEEAKRASPAPHCCSPTRTHAHAHTLVSEENDGLSGLPRRRRPRPPRPRRHRLPFAIGREPLRRRRLPGELRGRGGALEALFFSWRRRARRVSQCGRKAAKRRERGEAREESKKERERESRRFSMRSIDGSSTSTSSKKKKKNSPHQLRRRRPALRARLPPRLPRPIHRPLP